MNRVVPVVFAACLGVATPSGPAMGNSNSATRHTLPVTSVPPPLVGAAIDVGEAVNSGVPEHVLSLGLKAMSCAARVGAVEAPPTLTLIDYSKPSTEPRLWTFDLSTGELLFSELVAHGKNTGENVAVQFSNEMNSLQSSLGLFVTDEPYFGSNGYSLRLDGLDVGFNDRARERAIVLHGAPYVDERFATKHGRIGRSWGCPAVRSAVAAAVINRIRGGSVIFSYYPDQNWLSSSQFLQGCAA